MRAYVKKVLEKLKIFFNIKLDNFDDYVCNKLKEAEEELENDMKVYTSQEVFNSVEDILK